MRKLNLIKVILTAAAGLLTLASCEPPIPDQNCAFLHERNNLHKEYYATALKVYDLDNIQVLLDDGDLEKTTIYGKSKHFIGVDVLIEHIAKKKPDDHKLDENDFTLKDTTGFQLGNVSFVGSNNGIAMSNKSFAQVDSYTDYTWNNKVIESDTSMNLSLYFEVPKEIKAADTLTVLEIDFFYNKVGIDIVLANRPEPSSEVKDSSGI